jgi:hypothetical protein
MTIRLNIGRKNVKDHAIGMIMGAAGRENYLGIVKNILVLG